MDKFQAFQFSEVLVRDDAMRIYLVAFDGPNLFFAAAISVDEIDAFVGRSRRRG